jgi:hypothetical protein
MFVYYRDFNCLFGAKFLWLDYVKFPSSIFRVHSLSSSNSLQENARLMAMHYNETIKPAHGLFFDFSVIPEYEKPVLDYLNHYFGRAVEKCFFIRKPHHLKTILLN